MISIAIIASGVGYVYNEAISSPGSIYTVNYYNLEKAKDDLTHLTIRLNNEAPIKYNSNGYVPSDWIDTNSSGCKTRSDILLHSLKNLINQGCNVQSGELFDYYTGKNISFADGIDIDHIVAKKNVWDSGGYNWDRSTWIEYVNDEDRVLIATSSSANRSKGSKDAADWLPENTEHWCKYIIQQIEIKKFYNLSVTENEKDKMQEILTNHCKTQ